MKLQDHLSKKKLTERQFAELIGVSQVAVNRYCKGRVPAAEVMKKIIEVTNGRVTANDFFAEQ